MLTLHQTKGMRHWLWIWMALAFTFTAEAEEEYYPLAAGQERTMTVSISMPDGSTIEGVAHRKVEGSDTRDGKTYFHCRTWFEGMPFKGGSSKLVRKDEKGVYSIDERTPDSPECVTAVLPFKVGATWERTVRGMVVTDTVMQRETIDVAGVTYRNCFHIQSTWSGGKFTKDTWEAPRVGTVKEQTAYADGLKFTYTLREFKPGK